MSPIQIGLTPIQMGPIVGLNTNKRGKIPLKKGKFGTIRAHQSREYDHLMSQKFCPQVGLIEIFLTQLIPPQDGSYIRPHKASRKLLK